MAFEIVDSKYGLPRRMARSLRGRVVIPRRRSGLYATRIALNLALEALAFDWQLHVLGQGPVYCPVVASSQAARFAAGA